MLLLRLLRTQMTIMAMMMTARAATTGTTRLRLVRKYMILCSSSSGPVSALLSPPSSRAGARVPGEVLFEAAADLFTFQKLLETWGGASGIFELSLNVANLCQHLPTPKSFSSKSYNILL